MSALSRIVGTSLVSTVGLRLSYRPCRPDTRHLCRNFPGQHGGIATFYNQNDGGGQHGLVGTSLVSTVGLRLLEHAQQCRTRGERVKTSLASTGGIATTSPFCIGKRSAKWSELPWSVRWYCYVSPPVLPATKPVRLERGKSPWWAPARRPGVQPVSTRIPEVEPVVEKPLQWHPNRSNRSRIISAFFANPPPRGPEAQARVMPDKKHARPRVPF